jgi:hypothetical protein
MTYSGFVCVSYYCTCMPQKGYAALILSYHPIDSPMIFLHDNSKFQGIDLMPMEKVNKLVMQIVYIRAERFPVFICFKVWM